MNLQIMKIERLDVADGRIEEIRSNVKDVTVILLDWKERWLRLTFNNIYALENFNIEGEDLFELRVESENQFIDLVLKMTEDVEESDLPLFCYSFFTRYIETATMRIVASDCQVEILPNPQIKQVRDYG